jgi:hypothetical protein
MRMVTFLEASVTTHTARRKRDAKLRLGLAGPGGSGMDGFIATMIGVTQRSSESTSGTCSLTLNRRPRSPPPK